MDTKIKYRVFEAADGKHYLVTEPCVGATELPAMLWVDSKGRWTATGKLGSRPVDVPMFHNILGSGEVVGSGEVWFQNGSYDYEYVVLEDGEGPALEDIFESVAFKVKKGKVVIW